MAVQFGVYYTFRNVAGDAATTLYRETLDHVEVVEALGYDFVGVAEHHFLPEGCAPTPLSVLGAFAARTSTIKLATYVLVLPLHQPLRVAEHAAVVDLVSGGRLILGVAGGYRPEEFAAFEIDRRRRRSMMDEGIELIRAAWADALVDFHGESYTVTGVGVTPKPVRPEGPPIWVGGFARAAVERAVRLGDGYMLGGIGAVGPAGPYRWYQEALEDYGRTKAEVPLIGNRIVYVADDDATAWRDVEQALLIQHNSYARWFEEAGMDGHKPVDSADDLPKQNYIVGAPQSCIERIRAYREQFPVDVLTFDAFIPGVTRDAARRSVELFATEVRPAFS